MTLDIEKFHRRTPIAPAQKRWFVAQGFPGKFYIQHCGPFGARSSESNSGQISGCTMEIWRYEGISPSFKWSDDHTIFRFPVRGDGSLNNPFVFSYDSRRVLDSVASLGVPWHPLTQKGQDFSNSFVYVGFAWDIQRRHVRLPDEKRLKYLDLTRSFLAAHSITSNKCSLKTLLKLQGVFVHIAFVYMLGPSYIAPLFLFSCEFEGVLSRERYPPRSVIRAVDWWRSQLEDSSTVRFLQPRSPTLFLDIFVDASTGWGIGFLWGGKWAAWHARDNWKGPGRDIGWLEGVAVEIVVYALEECGFHDCCIRVYSDNDGVVGAFDKGRSRNFEVNLSIRRAAIIMAARNILLDLEYIESSQNPADPISRGILGREDDRLALRLQLPEELQQYFDRV